MCLSKMTVRAVVVAQLVEQSLLIPEVRGSNLVIGKILLNIYLLSTNEAGNGPFLKKMTA